MPWDQAGHTLKRAMARGLSRKDAVAMARIGVDEESFRQAHRTMTIGSVVDFDIDRGTVGFGTDGRRKTDPTVYCADRKATGLHALRQTLE